MARSLLPFAVALGVLAAGCAQGPAPPPGAASTDPRALPPGCDASRPAVAHLAGGIAVDAPGVRPIPCASYTGSGSGEPTLGVSPTTGAVFFFPAYGAGGNVMRDPVGVAISRDEGATWERVAPQTAGVSPHVVDFDPYFHLDAATGRIYADNLATINCSILSWSDDEGATWTHAASGCLETDHQTIFTGSPTLAPTPVYRNVVYRCAVNAVALAGGSTMTTCQRSRDGGLTWLPPGAPAFVGVAPESTSYCDGATGHGVTDAKGRVYLPKGLCGEPWLAWSDDEGLTWTRVRVSDLGMNRGSDGYPGHDGNVGVDAAGTVYYFWIAKDRLPYLTLSRDGGLTWDTPRMVAAPGVRETTLPSLAVAEDGRLALLYMGSTNSPGAPFPFSECDEPICVGAPPQPPGYEAVTWNGYLATSADAVTFLSATVNDPHDPLVRGACTALGCPRVFDFLDVVFGPDGSLWGSFVDACVGACATSTSTQANANDGLVGRLWSPS